MATAAISTNDVARAKTELARMRSSLRRWLKYRAVNDGVLAGTGATKKPLGYAQTVIAQGRDPATEQKLATQLSVLLAAIQPDVTLPNASVAANPNAAVQLAQMALNGGSPAAGGALGTLAQPWLWPVLIVSALLLGVTTAIKSSADLAAQKEQYACIEAGACTDYGFYMKWGAILFGAWFVWKELGVGHHVKAAIARKGGR